MAERVKLHDKEFEKFIDREKIKEAVEKVSSEINRDLADKNPLFLVILNGAFVFAADLLRRYPHDCDISFIKLSSYLGTKTSHTVREVIGLDTNVKDRTVVLVEDIIDTGITMEHIVAQMKNMEAQDVRLATLLFKPHAFEKDFTIDYIGMEVPNDFIVGCGLDYDGKGRNLPDLYKIVE
ncbi:MAG: hypoxanthine phosphoribosyltransferase [Bacteroidales bacterium]|nr:hypoxanthine phosphoribosyltransferase [Bacteroidales bacterium]MCF8338170.1 hypoxanthine phosphoribosyltransferase [Bacteroidales bacterium]